MYWIVVYLITFDIILFIVGVELLYSLARLRIWNHTDLDIIFTDGGIKSLLVKELQLNCTYSEDIRKFTFQIQVFID